MGPKGSTHSGPIATRTRHRDNAPDTTNHSNTTPSRRTQASTGPGNQTNAQAAVLANTADTPAIHTAQKSCNSTARRAATQAVPVVADDVAASHSKSQPECEDSMDVDIEVDGSATTQSKEKRKCAQSAASAPLKPNQADSTSSVKLPAQKKAKTVPKEANRPPKHKFTRKTALCELSVEESSPEPSLGLKGIEEYSASQDNVCENAVNDEGESGEDVDEANVDPDNVEELETRDEGNLSNLASEESCLIPEGLHSLIR
ncbi:hypothetical protein BC628DRAFT_1340429 [Trametes gibbosa]|nr:hypothetical protein BC628DRAFT_1340429 [Trametes gibbosa]